MPSHLCLRYPIRDEADCRAYLQVLLIGAAMLPKVENHSAEAALKLRLAAAAGYSNLNSPGSLPEVQHCHAAKQNASRRYGAVQPGKELLRAALVFSGEERRFVAWRCIR